MVTSTSGEFTFLTCCLLVGPLVGGYLCPGCGLVSLGFIVCLAQAVGGVGFAFAQVVGFFYLVGLPFGFCLFLFWADAPFPIFIGEVLSVFLFLCGPWSLVFFLVGCGALPFW